MFWIDFENVVNWFESISINTNPDMLLYSKSIFDFWEAKDMFHGPSIFENKAYEDPSGLVNPLAPK